MKFRQDLWGFHKIGMIKSAMNPKYARILKTIDELQDYLSKLEEARAYTLAKFQKDWNLYFSVERLIQLVVECIIAIGEDIISNARLKKPKTYRETFAILQKAGIVSGALSERLQFLAEFRNKLVHAYATISQEKIYHIYTQDIKVVKAFIDVVKEYLQKHAAA